MFILVLSIFDNTLFFYFIRRLIVLFLFFLEKLLFMDKIRMLTPFLLPIHDPKILLDKRVSGLF